MNMQQDLAIDHSVPAQDKADQTSGEQGPFYIPATGPSGRPRHTMKHGDTFAVFDSHGDMGASAGGPDGLFNHDTRFLARFELLIHGMQPLLLGSRLGDDNISLSVDLTNPDVYRNGAIVLPKDTIHIVRTSFLWCGVAYQRIHISNHGEDPLDLVLSLIFGCDFSDLFEARGTRRTKRGTSQEPIFEGGRVEFSYLGLDDKTRKAVLRFEPTPQSLVSGAATYSLSLKAGETTTLFFSAECHGEDSPTAETFIKGLMSANRYEKAMTRSLASVETSNEILNEVMCRSAADIYMLLTETPQGPYPYAGTPWYSTTFGRDGILTAIEMLWCDPGIAKGVLQRLAHYQATTTDPLADAEPGKILHEMRGGEMAALREVPFGLYYGSVDSTPLFIVLAGEYLGRTGDIQTIERLWPAIEAGLSWMDVSGDRDGDGFLEYARADQAGLRNQGWKDSFDSVFHADGALAEGPIALVEVQGYAYAAKILAASMARRLGHIERGAALEHQAKTLAAKFEEAFWCEEIGTYAIALDGEKKACRVRTSNAGQVLWTGIARADRAKRVADGMVSANFFSGWGVRTVAKGEPRYNPMSYHNGSIWPHDNALIALGFARYGLVSHAERVFEGLFGAATYMDLRRLPELFCGFRRRRGAAPTLYPVACAPQAWAAGTPFLLVQAVLGMEFDPATRSIRFRNPKLPRFMEEVTLRNVGFDNARVDITLIRAGDHVALRVLQNHGALQVSMILA